MAQTPTLEPTPLDVFATPGPFGVNGISHWGKDNQGRRRTMMTLPSAPDATETPVMKNYVAFAKEDIGADWDRWSVHWNMVEDYRGNFNFANDSNQVAIVEGLNLATENHIKVVLNLNGGIAGQYNNVVCESLDADGKCPRYHYDECDDTNDPNTCYAIKGLSYEGKDQAGNWRNPWARFINEVTSNSAIRDRVAVWEIINEHNLIPYYVPKRPKLASEPSGEEDSSDTNPFARNFIRAITVACEVLAETNQGENKKPALLGGIEHAPAYKLALNTLASDPNNFYRRVIETIRTTPSLKNCIDGISLHSYGNPKDSAFLIENHDVIWDPTGSEPWPSDKQIWITESGLQHESGAFLFNGTGCGTDYVCGPRTA